MYQLIEWSDELNVGIPELDDHHRVLVGLLNELHAAIHRRKGLETCREILQRFSRFADVHFTLEEDFLHKRDHRNFDRHRDEHRRVMREISALLAQIDTLQSTISFHRLHKLKVWLLKHILAADEGISQHRRRQVVRLEARRERLERLGT